MQQVPGAHRERMHLLLQHGLGGLRGGALPPRLLLRSCQARLGFLRARSRRPGLHLAQACGAGESQTTGGT